MPLALRRKTICSSLDEIAAFRIRQNRAGSRAWLTVVVTFFTATLHAASLIVGLTVSAEPMASGRTPWAIVATGDLQVAARVHPSDDEDGPGERHAA